MEDLSMALRAMFSQIKGDDILTALYLSKNMESKHLDAECQESKIVKLLLREDSDSYSIDQLSMISQLVTQKWMMQDKDCLSLYFHEGDTVFNMLLHFSAKTLMVKDGDPVCRYRSLLRWHGLTVQLGEDLFTTSFLASHDIKNEYRRQYFDWASYLGHDCKEINSLFKKPMAELHMHLKGSLYNVDISWACLMNNVMSMRQKFENVALKRKDTEWDPDLYEKVKKAAIIRYYLAGVIECHNNPITKSEMADFLDGKKPGLKGDHILTFESYVKDSHRIAEEKMSKYDGVKGIVLDYIPVKLYNKYPVSALVMASERKLMYECFRKIYSNDYSDTDFPTLFYAYLAYKEYFRHVILQLNTRVGFANFSNYEELKSEFILKKYYPLLYKAAIEGFIGYTKNRYVEARIVPKESAKDIEKALGEIYDSLREDTKNKCSIIFHFIKTRDSSYTVEHSMRNDELRQKVKCQALAICNFRLQNENKDSLVGRVVGIDAANSEIFARPEAFAQAFRFLRGHEVFSTEYNRPNDLNITYHVGEDFLDVADGLRAVEEALIFLGLRNGDRLGHALALGTDVRAYYAKRYNTICESKQVILDNLAWLHHKCIKLKGAISLLGYLEMMFHKYFREIYDTKVWSCQTAKEVLFAEPNPDLQQIDDIETYYLSWLLRGNSPSFGRDMKNYGKVSNKLERLWIDAGINHHVGVDIACQNSNARDLYDMYHSCKFAENSNSVDSFLCVVIKGLTNVNAISRIFIVPPLYI